MKLHLALFLGLLLVSSARAEGKSESLGNDCSKKCSEACDKSKRATCVSNCIYNGEFADCFGPPGQARKLLGEAEPKAWGKNTEECVAGCKGLRAEERSKCVSDCIKGISE